MKTLMLSGLAAATLLSFSACKTVEESPRVHSTTTTTEEHTVQPVSSTTTESQTTRSL